MKKKNDKQRLFEVMSRLDKTFKPKLNETTSKGKEIVYTFKNEAITGILGSSNDKKYTHPVHLLQGDPKYAEKYNGLVLSISDTPGAWYVDTLMEEPLKYGSYIYIDYGQRWACINWDVIMNELQQWLSENFNQEPSDPDIGHHDYLKQSDQLKSFDDDSMLNEENRPLNQIAREIYQDWKPVSPYAAPYLDAMSSLSSIDDNYMFDSGREIVARFLSNAGQWKGETAKRIKAELKKMLGLRENEEEISVEPQEHGPEGPNYKAKLEHIVDHAQKIYEGLSEGELPSWVQDKITIADDYLDAIYSWMHSEEEEEEGEIEGAEREMDSEELENTEEI